MVTSEKLSEVGVKTDTVKNPGEDGLWISKGRRLGDSCEVRRIRL